MQEAIHAYMLRWAFVSGRFESLSLGENKDEKKKQNENKSEKKSVVMGGKRKKEFVPDSKANLVKLTTATNTQSRWQEKEEKEK